MFPFDIDPEKVKKARDIAGKAGQKLQHGLGTAETMWQVERNFKRDRRENGRPPHKNFKSSAAAGLTGAAIGAAAGGYGAYKSYGQWYKQSKRSGASKQQLAEIRRRRRIAVRNGALVGAGIGGVAGLKIYDAKSAGERNG